MDIKKLTSKYFTLYFYLLVFFLPLSFIQKCEDAYYLPKLTLLAGGLQYLVLTFTSGAVKRFRLVDWALTAFILLYPVGIINAVEKPAAVIKCLEWAASAGVFFYASYFLNQRERDKAVLLMASSALLVGGYALLQAFSLDLKGWVTNFSGRAFSSLGNPDFLGGFLAISLPLAILINKKFSPYVLTVLCAVLALSQTRSSVVAAVAALVLLAILIPSYFTENKKVLAIGAAVCLVLVITSGTAGSFAKRTAESLKPSDTAVTGRFAMWDTGIQMIKDRFFTGTGAGCINNVYQAYARNNGYTETDHLHNDFIEIFAESGAGAFGSFVIFLGLSVATAASARSKTPLLYAAMASLAAMAVQASFNFPFYVLDTKLYIFAILGMGLAAGKKPEIHTAASAAGFLASAAAVTCCLFFTVGGAYLNRVIVSPADEAVYDNMDKAERFYPYFRKYYYLAEADLEKSQYIHANRYSAIFMAKNPYSKTGVIQAGIIAAETGDLAGSLKCFETYLAKHPADTDVLNDYGKVLFMKGDTKAAVDAYRKVISLDPKNDVAHRNLYGIFENKGMAADAGAEEKRWSSLTGK